MNTNPIDQDVVKVRGAFNRYNLLHVQWHLGNYCNYRCSYCNDTLRDGSHPFVNIDIAKRVVTNITTQLANTDKRAEFTLSGGEPTVYAELEELLQHMYDCGAYAHIITNASRSVNYYKRIVPLLTHGAILTYHSDHAKLDKFLEVLALFDPRLLTVYIPMNPQKWDECRIAFDTINALGVRAVPKTIFDDFGSGKSNIMIYYTKPQREFINSTAHGSVNSQTPIANPNMILPKVLMPKAKPKSQLNYRTIEIFKQDGTVSLTTPQNLIINKQNDFRGFSCNVGIDFLLIGYNGNILPANCSKKAIGNINDNPEFVLPSIPVVCDIPLCWCEGDLLINKFKNA